MTVEIQEFVDKIMMDIGLHREEIIEAFIAKYGYQPDEIEQVVDMSRFSEGIITWSVRKKGGNDVRSGV